MEEMHLEPEADRVHTKFDTLYEKMNDASMRTGESAIRTAILINGGAAVALLAFLGGLASQGRIKHEQLVDVAQSLMWFASGVSFAGAATACAFFTDRFLANYANSVKRTQRHPYREYSTKTQKFRRLFQLALWAAIVSALLSLSCFIAGMLAVKGSVGRLENLDSMPFSTHRIFWGTAE